MMIQAIPLSLIRDDPDLQMREAGIDPAVVADYAEAMDAGAEFPPVILFFDGEGYWPGDGFHRIEAGRKLNRETIDADVREGGKREAMLLAVGANANHGLRRTSADKRRSVLAMLRDPEWSKWSDREIGKRCAVDHKTVAKVRAELTGEIPTQRTYTSRHGTVTTMKVRQAEPATTGGSVVERMLSTLTTEALIAECRRRGLEVSGYED
ncbi:MAG: hypothetical protein KK478_00155 [Ensifer alkalisoli]|nr:hypothetical protein [Sinorhizobium alkalisoli]